MNYIMIELEKNGLSMEILEQLVYETHMQRSLKNTLHKFDKKEIFQEIADIIEFYQDCCLLDDISLDYRIKSMDSCVRKYQKYYPNTPFEKAFNDLLGFRMLVDDYRYLLQDELPQGMRLVDTSTGKARNDGYRGIHLYYQPSHHVYPIEIQVNTFYDRQLNNWLHKYIYKKGYPDTIGLCLREAYERGKIGDSEEKFQEVLNRVLSDR